MAFRRTPCPGIVAIHRVQPACESEENTSGGRKSLWDWIAPSITSIMVVDYVEKITWEDVVRGACSQVLMLHGCILTRRLVVAFGR